MSGLCAGRGAGRALGGLGCRPRGSAAHAAAPPRRPESSRAAGPPPAPTAAEGAGDPAGEAAYFIWAVGAGRFSGQGRRRRGARDTAGRARARPRPRASSSAGAARPDSYKTIQTTSQRTRCAPSPLKEARRKEQ